MTCPAVIEVITPGPPGPPGDGSATITGPAVLGRAEATAGFAVALPLGTGLSIVGGALTATGATNLSYDPATRTVASSTGADAVLTLADGVNAGLMSSSDYLKLLSLTFGVLPVPVFNNTGATIAKGTPVYVTGSSGTRITIAPADASLEVTAARTLGLTSAAIANNTDGTVIAVGELTGLNTSSLTEGQIIWLSETTGAMTTTRPTQPAHGVVLGYCVKQGAGTSGIVYVKVGNGLEIDELHDVLITGKATGQALMVAADGLWKNRLLVVADLSDSSATGRAVVTAVDQAAGRTAIGAEQAGAAAAAQAFAVQRGNHTGTQTASTISDFTTAARGTVSAAGSLSYNPSTGVFSYTAPTPFDPASPGAIGGTAPGAGTFTAGTFTQSILLPSAAPGTPAAGHLYRVADTLRYRDSGAVERLLLNATDNLANLNNTATARDNLGAAAAYRQCIDLAAVAGVYTIDVQTTAQRIIKLGTIAGNVTINLANGSTAITSSVAANIPTGTQWEAVIRYTWTSGAITFLAANTGISRLLLSPDLTAPVSGKIYEILLAHERGATVMSWRQVGGQP